MTTATIKNAATALQEYLQGKGEATPEYYYLRDGPARNFRWICRVHVDGKFVATSTGHSKKQDARDEAAKKALEILAPDVSASGTQKL